MEKTHPGCHVPSSRIARAGEKETGSNVEYLFLFFHQLHENSMLSDNFFLLTLGLCVGSPHHLWEGCSDLYISRDEF